MKKSKTIQFRYIYKSTVTNPKGLVRIYIGKHESRYFNLEDDNYVGSGDYIQKIKNKPGYAIDFEIIEFVSTLDVLNEREKFWISEYRKTGQCVNIKDGGDGFSSNDLKRMWSNPEYRETQLKALAKGKSTKEFSEKISKINKLRCSESEYRKKMSNAMKTAFENDPTLKIRISNTVKSLWKSDEYRNKLINHPGKIEGTKKSWNNPLIRKSRLDTRNKKLRSVEPWISIEKVKKLWEDLGKPHPQKYKWFREKAIEHNLPDVSYNAILKALKKCDYKFTPLENSVIG
ncbi:hypothetical protein [Escherichia phage vB_EcoM-ZQ3]|uniref:Homing endonuclease n=2 Tax=Mosigvirus TaxID=1913652 RepID=A0A8F3HM79_9CAUD|nr:hypothetical protein KMC05_gp228 [Escherichia phage F2]QIG57562.1 hypothetical protein [Escherichia phage F2]QWY13391.1 hypothetical protein [Escherichia phage vB_EcoM-ZQ3]